MQFNREQQKAIRHLNGPMMVLAGPGSGKTTVLVHRILHMVETHGILPEQLLVLTFTRAAAREMELRCKKLQSERACDARLQTCRESTQGLAGQITFGTFHSVFFQFLCSARGYTARNIAGERQCFAVLREVLSRAFAAQRFTTDMTELLLAAIGSYKNAQHPEDVDYPVEQALFVRIYEAYGKAMRRAGLLDFDDMLLECLSLLRQEPDKLLALRRRFAYLMVDEFQDINQTQFEIVRLLAAPRNNLFIVGDDDQSIYGFRGAKPQLMLSFPKVFPQCKTVVLGTNYRSDERIVAHSLKLIGHNQQRYEKALHAAAAGRGRAAGQERSAGQWCGAGQRYSASQEHAIGQARGAGLWVHGVRNASEEAAVLAKDIAAARKRGTAYSDMAVLCRTKKLAAQLPEALAKAGIPFLRFGEKPAEDVGKRAAPFENTAKLCAEDALRLMTFHASKGLEFEEVWIIGANEGDTPSKLAEDAAQVEEERRMFYVAMTRAKERLHIFVTLAPYNQTQKASRFVTEAGLALPKLTEASAG